MHIEHLANLPGRSEQQVLGDALQDYQHKQTEKSRISYQQLFEKAARYKPLQSWFDAPEEDLFQGCAAMLRQGAIIRAIVPDPQGGNPKIHPLLVVAPDAEITKGVNFSRSHQYFSADTFSLAGQMVDYASQTQGCQMHRAASDQASGCGGDRGFVSRQILRAVLQQIDSLT